MTRRILPVLLVLCMLLNMFLAMPTVASAEVIGSASVWRTNAIIYPAQEQLIPAGPIWVKWNALANAVRYVVYLDDKPGEVVKATSEGTMEYKVYTVDVDTHTIWIEAELSNGQKVLTSPRTFYVSKKGIGFFDALSNMQNMNLSW
jgi:Rieske Fe-S protein